MADQIELTRPAAARRLETVNPATGEPGKSYDPHSVDDAHEAARAAQAAFLEWRRTGFPARSAILHEAASILRARKDEFARLMTEEMGKTLDDGRSEVENAPSIATGSPITPPPTWPTSRRTSAAARHSSPSTRSASSLP